MFFISIDETRCRRLVNSVDLDKTVSLHCLHRIVCPI